jgi:PTH1 family peptidyl-tRNA hydrolase
MNQSGSAVQPFVAYFSQKLEEICIVHDDLELPFGQVGWKFGGGLGGHNGLKSIAERLGSRDFYRFRIGIGRPVHGSVQSHVLSRFSQQEEECLGEILHKSWKILHSAFENPEGYSTKTEFILSI